MTGSPAGAASASRLRALACECSCTTCCPGRRSSRCAERSTDSRVDIARLHDGRDSIAFSYAPHQSAYALNKNHILDISMHYCLLTKLTSLDRYDHKSISRSTPPTPTRTGNRKSQPKWTRIKKNIEYQKKKRTAE